MVGHDSSVGIETRYGLEVGGSNPGEGEVFRTRPDRPWGPPIHLYKCVQGFFPGCKAGGMWC